MANLTVAQAHAVNRLISYLNSTDDIGPHLAVEALLELRRAAYAKLLSGPSPDDAGDAIFAVEQLRARTGQLHEQWAALYPDGSWTSGENLTRAEAEEIVTSRKRDTDPPILAVRWESDWKVVDHA